MGRRQHFDFDLVERQRMRQRHQLRGPLRSQDAGQTRHHERIALGQRRQLQHRRLRQHDPARGGGFAPRHRFVVSDDEPRFRKVSELFLGEKLSDVEVVPLG